MRKPISLAKAYSPAALVEQIDRMVPAEAVEAVSSLAHHHGDTYAQKILEQLPSLKIAAMLMRFDFSCPSIISAVLSPGKVVAIIKQLPLFWRHVADYERDDHLRAYRTQALDLLNNFLSLNRNPDRQAAILDGISHDDICCDYLYLAFYRWQINEEQCSLFEHHDVEPGTCEQLFEIIRWCAPGLAGRVRTFAGETAGKNAECAPVSLRQHIMDISEAVFDVFFSSRALRQMEAVMFVPLSLSEQED